MPGLENSEYRAVPISFSICAAEMASTTAWIWFVGMLGSKTRTLGPKSGGLTVAATAAADPAVSAGDAAAPLAAPAKDAAVSTDSASTSILRIDLCCDTVDRRERTTFGRAGSRSTDMPCDLPFRV